MKTYRIDGATGTSTIVVGGRLDQLRQSLPLERMIIITDGNVRALYETAFPAAPVITVEPGESSKSLEGLAAVFDGLLELEADRSCFIVGIGGGVVCDITGFAASTFMRGLRFGFVASSLLAQVDASVGGKNGVNFRGYKNLIGTFNQPEFVICDADMLKTLPAKEVRCGLAEVVKHALIRDAGLMAYLEANVADVVRLEPEATERMVADSVVIKSTVVNADEKEVGLRRILNFGHTFGHAVENIQGISHGEAVAVGMLVAAEISVLQGLLSADDARRIRRLLECLELPVRCSVSPADLLDAVRKDKKRQSDAVHFVFLRRIGRAVVRKISFEQLAPLLKKALAAE
jgi:3-dehydroquinate synthase